MTCGWSKIRRTHGRKNGRVYRNSPKSEINGIGHRDNPKSDRIITGRNSEVINEL
jgi:hypothetical protein